MTVKISVKDDENSHSDLPCNEFQCKIHRSCVDAPDICTDGLGRLDG